ADQDTHMGGFCQRNGSQTGANATHYIGRYVENIDAAIAYKLVSMTEVIHMLGNRPPAATAKFAHAVIIVFMGYTFQQHEIHEFGVTLGSGQRPPPVQQI